MQLNNRFSIPTFPNSLVDPFILTSPITAQYNCIAWAYGDVDRFYWPVTHPMAYWPPGVRRKTDIASFVALYSSIGYKVSFTKDRLIRGFEKIAIYANAVQEPQHAARQLPNGMWTSKLGRNHDITHTLKSMADGEYGNAVVFMERKIKSQY